ncbi:MAG: hypothetical protein LC659_03405, partial [Myxococcales bacterium]|nr:hypothetical protein [Myxococcales bacterium]
GNDEARDMAPDDLTAAAPLDVATPADFAGDDLSGDLALRNYDLAWSMCAGTKLAGTCVEQFFEPFVACFRPAGHCGDYLHNTGDEICWQDGAKFHGPATSTPPWAHIYSMAGTQCLLWYSFFNQTIQQYCNASDPCTQSGVEGSFMPTSGAQYDTASGIFTCPSGEQVAIGADLGGCPVLNLLLAPGSVCDRSLFEISQCM